MYKDTTLFDVLQYSGSNFDINIIKNNRRKLQRIVHPDKLQDDKAAAHKLASCINQAYEILSNEKKHLEYYFIGRTGQTHEFIITWKDMDFCLWYYRENDIWLDTNRSKAYPSYPTFNDEDDSDVEIVEERFPYNKNGESRTGTDTEEPMETNAENGTEAEAEAEANSEAESEAEPECEAECDAEAEAEAETEPEVEVEPETGADREAEAEVETEADTNTKTEAEPETMNNNSQISDEMEEKQPSASPDPGPGNDSLYMEESEQNNKRRRSYMKKIKRIVDHRKRKDRGGKLQFKVQWDGIKTHPEWEDASLLTENFPNDLLNYVLSLSNRRQKPLVKGNQIIEDLIANYSQ